MIRTILKSDHNQRTIKLPDDLVGKVIEIIAFEVNDEELKNPHDQTKPSQLRGFLSKNSSDLMHDHINQSRSEWDIL